MKTSDEDYVCHQCAEKGRHTDWCGKTTFGKMIKDPKAREAFEKASEKLRLEEERWQVREYQEICKRWVKYTLDELRK